jgi:hypothetical protein
VIACLFVNGFAVHGSLFAVHRLPAQAGHWLSTPSGGATNVALPPTANRELRTANANRDLPHDGMGFSGRDIDEAVGKFGLRDNEYPMLGGARQSRKNHQTGETLSAMPFHFVALGPEFFQFSG